MSLEGQTLLEEFLRRRDETAFRRLYRHHTPGLFALAVRLAGARNDAEEIVQEAWVRAVERLDRFGGRSSFRTWLCGIVVNCHRERARRRLRDPEPLDVAPAAKVVAFPGRRPKADTIDVERALARLPDGYREVVVLYYLNGYTHREIGDLLGIDPGTSKSQLSRGRARLRELLAPEAPNQEKGST